MEAEVVVVGFISLVAANKGPALPVVANILPAAEPGFSFSMAPPPNVTVLVLGTSAAGAGGGVELDTAVSKIPPEEAGTTFPSLAKTEDEVAAVVFSSEPVVVAVPNIEEPPKPVFSDSVAGTDAPKGHLGASLPSPESLPKETGFVFAPNGNIDFVSLGADTGAAVVLAASFDFKSPELRAVGVVSFFTWPKLNVEDAKAAFSPVEPPKVSEAVVVELFGRLKENPCVDVSGFGPLNENPEVTVPEVGCESVFSCPNEKLGVETLESVGVFRPKLTVEGVDSDFD